MTSIMRFITVMLASLVMVTAASWSVAGERILGYTLSGPDAVKVTCFFFMTAFGGAYIANLLRDQQQEEEDGK